MDFSPPSSSVHGILQARILEWVAISFSKGSSQTRDQTQVSHIVGRCFNLRETREAPCKDQTYSDNWERLEISLLSTIRDLFKKIRDTKGTFHAKMGSIKDRYGMDLTEAEDIKKRWQGYTEELYKKRSSRPR